MSTHPRSENAAAPVRALTPPDILAKSQAGERLVMVTAYDFPSALAVEEAGVDLVLVGDSGAMVVLGHDSTVGVTVDEMLVLTRATARGLRRPALIGDLPFGSYETSDAQAVETAMRFVKEGGCCAVKLEGGSEVPLARAKAIMAAGIPVMGHVGLTPQTASALGGYRAQGRTAEAALRVEAEAKALDDAGCFAIVLEAVPAELAAHLTPALSAATIGIGAGPDCNGQVLVLHDMIGAGSAGKAKFVKRYAESHQLVVDAVSVYADEVRGGQFPASEHCYSMPAAQREQWEASR